MELGTCLPLFMERLCNEVTRLSAVKALTMIAASPLRVDLSPILVSGRENLICNSFTHSYSLCAPPRAT